jgi:UDP-N-acetylmuramate--alanine ligase
LFDEFTRSFYQSDALFVLPIYAAGEKEIKGVDSNSLFESIKAHGHKNVSCVEKKGEVVSRLKEILCKGDILLTLGAGDVWKVGQGVLGKPV